MKLLSVSLLAGTLATPALACDLCSIYSAAQARAEIGKGFSVSLAEQFTSYGTLQQDSAEVANGTGQFFDSSVTQIVTAYHFTERFGVQFNLPVIRRSFARPEGAAFETGTVSGLGDAALAFNLEAFRWEAKHATFAWSLLGGVKLPTGSADRLQEEVDELTAPPPPPGRESAIHGHDLALGSGSVDGIIGTSVYARWQRVYFSAAMQYGLRTTGRFGYRHAADVTWAGGPGCYLALNDNYTVALQLNVTGETKGQDTFALMGGRMPDTAVTTVFVGPQIAVTWAEQFSAEAGVELPVSRRNTALQVVPDYRVRAGITWRF